MINIGCGYVFVFCEMVNAVGILAKESSGLAAPSRIIEPLRGTRAMLIIIALMPRTWLVFMAAWRPAGLLRSLRHSRDSGTPGSCHIDSTASGRVGAHGDNACKE